MKILTLDRKILRKVCWKANKANSYYLKDALRKLKFSNWKEKTLLFDVEHIKLKKEKIEKTRAPNFSSSEKTKRWNDMAYCTRTVKENYKRTVINNIMPTKHENK